MYKLIFALITFIQFGLSNPVFSETIKSESFHTQRENFDDLFQRLNNGGEVRVVFLGGSITYNPGWRDSVSNYLSRKFPATSFDFINAGIPSMGSVPGAFRFERDVLKNGKVDLLFEEAAVNDDTNGRTSKEIVRGMEGIIRHAKTANPECKIVLMHFADPGKIANYNNNVIPEVIQLHERVARHYNVSSINLAKEVTKRISAGEFSWDDDFKNLHPSPFGQGIYARSIIRFLENAQNSNQHFENKTALPEKLDEFCFSGGKLIEPNPPNAIKGWEMVENWKPANHKNTRANYVNVPMLVGKYPAKIIKFKFKGNAVGIAVAAGYDAGIIEYSIDNTMWQPLDLFTQWSKNLYLPWYHVLGTGLSNKKHVLQLRITNRKNQDSEGNTCLIRYFFVNTNE